MGPGSESAPKLQSPETETAWISNASGVVGIEMACPKSCLATNPQQQDSK